MARDYELFTEALRSGRGRIELRELRAALQKQESTGETFRHREEIATQASLDRERAMVATINRGIAAYAPLGGAFTPAEGLTDEQKHAIQFILTSRDLAVNLRGAAGTGKTRTLQELNRGLAENGRETLAVAPTVGAVEELMKVGFDTATTITRLLEDEELRHAARGKVVILDEAGMVSGRQMAEFLKIAETHSMRVVFSGDTKQLRSVEAGDALRILEHDSRLKSTSLTQVQRQKPEEYRGAIEELRRHPGRGFDKLEAMGAIREAHCLKRADEVARAYAEGARELNAKGKTRSVLVVAATHDELATVTDAIRAQRSAAGELAGSLSVDRHVPLNLTVAQKKDFGNFSAGQLLIFHRRVNGIRKNEVLEVERVEGQRLIAKTQSAGVERIITARQAKAFDVFHRRPFDLASGDRILMMANRKDRNFRATNGEIATVAGIDAQGRLRLEDGRTIPSDYRQIDYGYAITTHRSQGKTVDAVVISADAMRKELFYVAASRGRESVTVVTSDIEGLRRSIAISGDRQTATELNRRKLDSRQRAYRYSMAWARAHRSPVERKPAAIATEASRVQTQRHRQVKGVGYGI